MRESLFVCVVESFSARVYVVKVISNRLENATDISKPLRTILSECNNQSNEEFLANSREIVNVVKFDNEVTRN